MLTNGAAEVKTIGADPVAREEVPVVHKERWEEIRRLGLKEHVAIAEIARRFDLDRKTVRHCLREEVWHPYERPARADTLLAPYADYLRSRAPQVGYSAQILFQELRQRGYAGSYETVNLFVRPLRALRLSAELTRGRFETPPGLQSQIDWGQARVPFRQGTEIRHIFVLTLGFSRRSFYLPCLNESLPQFLDAHEQAFEYFGGHTREHLYDRPRTVCQGTAAGRIQWNSTFKAFADYWSFEPRLCRPYRAQTKGKVESGVKYFRRNFLPGRQFVDDADFSEQILQWAVEVADVRLHGTTHVRPLDRFAEEKSHLLPTAGQPSFRLEARHSRIVAEDWLVSFATNRYSVPFALIGQPVEVLRRQGRIHIFHRGILVVDHPELCGKYQVRLLPEHGPGAVARTARRRRSTVGESGASGHGLLPEVEVRDLAVYDALLGAIAGDREGAAPPRNGAPGGIVRVAEERSESWERSGALLLPEVRP